MFLETAFILSSAKDLFTYNRENYIFDNKLNIERIYQTQKMRIEAGKLYREDLRDLFELTINKLDNYLITSAIMLAFTTGFFYEGRLPEQTPAWLFYAWSLSIGTSIAFLVFACWFAVYGSITAQSFAIRILTKWVRLAVPNKDEISDACKIANDFENNADIRREQAIRIPFLQRFSKNEALRSGGYVNTYIQPFFDEKRGKNALVNYDEYVSHFLLFSQLQCHWNLFDAYCRVCMVLGSFFCVNGISIMGLGYFTIQYNLWGAIATVFILTNFNLWLLHLNIKISNRLELVFVTVMIYLFPSLIIGAAIFEAKNNSKMATNIAPFIYFASLLQIFYFGVCGMMDVSSEDEGLEHVYQTGNRFSRWIQRARNFKLPTKFINVVNIDILGLYVGHSDLDKDDDAARLLNPSKMNKPTLQHLKTIDNHNGEQILSSIEQNIILYIDEYSYNDDTTTIQSLDTNTTPSFFAKSIYKECTDFAALFNLNRDKCVLTIRKDDNIYNFNVLSLEFESSTGNPLPHKPHVFAKLESDLKVVAQSSSYVEKNNIVNIKSSRNISSKQFTRLKSYQYAKSTPTTRLNTRSLTSQIRTITENQLKLHRASGNTPRLYFKVLVLCVIILNLFGIIFASGVAFNEFDDFGWNSEHNRQLSINIQQHKIGSNKVFVGNYDVYKSIDVFMHPIAYIPIVIINRDIYTLHNHTIYVYDNNSVEYTPNQSNIFTCDANSYYFVNNGGHIIKYSNESGVENTPLILRPNWAGVAFCENYFLVWDHHGRRLQVPNKRMARYVSAR